jgi:hypothetical protein
VAHRPERAQGKGLRIAAHLGETWGLPLDRLTISERQQAVDPGREDRGPPDEGALDRQLHEFRDRGSITSLECGTQTRACKIGVVPFTRDPGSLAFELGESRLVPETQVRESEEKQTSGVAHARRLQVLGDCIRGTASLLRHCTPVTERISDLELQ